MITKRKKEYYEGKLPKLWPLLVYLHENNPQVFGSPGTLKQAVGVKWLGFQHKKACPNCEANMLIDVYKPDMLDMILLLTMGQVVKERVASGMSFTEANDVHVPEMDIWYSVKHRTTRCNYLNYIKQPNGWKQTGRWLITTWGWRVLRNEAVPKKVKYFRKRLVEDSREGSVTITELFNNHVKKVHDAIKAHKEPKTDFRKEIMGYKLDDWTNFIGTIPSESTLQPDQKDETTIHNDQ